MTDLSLAQACADIYVTREGWFSIYEVQGVYVGLRRGETYLDIICRGSTTLLDWVRDLEAIVRTHPVLGPVHFGFAQGIDESFETILPDLSKDMPIRVGGHSLGASHACYIAGLLTASGRPPTRLECYGCPNPGMEQLSDILRSGGFPIELWRNWQDPVATLPIALPGPLNRRWQKPTLDLQLVEVPASDVGDPYSYHHMPLYLSGRQKLASPGTGPAAAA